MNFSRFFFRSRPWGRPFRLGPVAGAALLAWLAWAPRLQGAPAPAQAATPTNDPKPAQHPAGPAAPSAPTLLSRFRQGPLAGVQEVVFAARRPNETDGHWYANFGYYAHDPDRKAFREGTRLYRLHLESGRLTPILDDPRGGIRDPQVHYDGRTVLFAYRPGGTEQYHLYEIQADGTGLRQLTDGPYDDLEPTYLPNGDLVFVSSRCKRWVNCWLTQVAVMHRCDPDGRNIRPISSNNEHDNTPWPLADGRILYTRWEYVDRSQVHYHHLWVTNPDGTSQMVFFGNLHPGITMIDAKPIPGSDKIVASFSPGHGQREHAGVVTVVDPRAGPDEPQSARTISRGSQFRDPWAFSEDAFMAATGSSLVLLDGQGTVQTIVRLPAEDIARGMECHEPRPLAPRPREDRVTDRVNPAAPTGQLVLADIYEGRNMTGVKRGEIKKLLVLETLPMPIHYTGGMEPISYGGTFTLERVVGTVPVEEDGSAFVELPALRSFFFVALDEHDLSVKRMQSFLTVQPGEVTSCVGCHEQRTRTPANTFALTTARALQRAPSPITPIAGVPDVLDFPRDIQPILDRHCVACHDATPDNRSRVILTGDRGPMFSHSYFTLTAQSQVADGRNRPQSSYAPRQLGSSASALLRKLDGSHHDVRVSAREQTLVRLWIESGGAYPGTYAALGCGMLGWYAENQPVRADLDWPETKALQGALQQRCASCHHGPLALPMTASEETFRPPWEQMTPDDPRRRISRHLLYNLTRPEKSLLLLAPLAREGGGLGLCRTAPAKDAGPARVFVDPADADYRLILQGIGRAAAYLDEIRRFDMPGFQPRKDWVREMQRYGILPRQVDPGMPIDVYATERRYWESLWHQPLLLGSR